MSRQELAGYMEVSSTAVYKWETGQTQPDIYALQRLAVLFEVTLDDLCDFRPRAPENENKVRNLSVMARSFSRLTEEEQEKYLAVGRALFEHAFGPEDKE